MGNMADLPVCYSNGTLSFVGHFYTLTMASDRLTDSGEKNAKWWDVQEICHSCKSLDAHVVTSIFGIISKSNPQTV